MRQFIQANSEVLSFCLSGLGILLALGFGGILSWRHKICLEYGSRRDVAINILRDRFVQRTSKHYSDVAQELEVGEAAVEEIYARPEQQRLIRELGDDLEDKNRVKRLYRWLVLVSLASFSSLWFSIVLLAAAIGLLWLVPPLATWIAWGSVLGLLLLCFAGSVSAMCVLDGRFFRLVNRIIDPEGD